MSLRVLSTVVAISLLVTGCGTATRIPERDTTAAISGTLRVDSVHVHLSPVAEMQHQFNAAFAPAALAELLARRLGQKGLQTGDSSNTLDVEMTFIHVRSEFIAFIVPVGLDVLSATVTVNDAAGRALRRFDISANSSAGTNTHLAKERTRLDILNEHLALLVIAQLQGQGCVTAFAYKTWSCDE